MELCHRLSTCIATVELMGAGMAPGSWINRLAATDLGEFLLYSILEKVSDRRELQPLFFEFRL